MSAEARFALRDNPPAEFIEELRRRFPVEREIDWYEYQLTVSFRDLSDGRKVYEATAVATGGAASIAGAMPYLARAVFADFPGLSGVTRRVEVPREAVAAETPEREQAAQPAR